MESQRLMPVLRRSGRKAIDLSADYRLKDAALYTTWYKAPHEDAARLAGGVSAPPEPHRKDDPNAPRLPPPRRYPLGAMRATPTGLPAAAAALRRSRRA